MRRNYSLGLMVSLLFVLSCSVTGGSVFPANSTNNGAGTSVALTAQAQQLMGTFVAQTVQAQQPASTNTPPESTPTIIPSPTTIPTQSLSDIINIISVVASGKPVPEAMPYDRKKPGPHHIVLIQKTGEVYEAYTDTKGDGLIPIEWFPLNVSEVELVAIITPMDTILQKWVYHYSDGTSAGTSLRIRKDINIKIIEAASGKEIKQVTLQGTPPPNLNTSVYNLKPEVTGNPPTFSTIMNWLKDYVLP